jgi:hypothetical protein
MVIVNLAFLFKIINSFHIGRGGLSLSFMGNYITKSAHASLLELIRNSMFNCVQSKTVRLNIELRYLFYLLTQFKQLFIFSFNKEISKAVLCLKDNKSNINGNTWLIPLILHRESQVISFSIIHILLF